MERVVQRLSHRCLGICAGDADYLRDWTFPDIAMAVHFARAGVGVQGASARGIGRLAIGSSAQPDRGRLLNSSTGAVLPSVFAANKSHLARQKTEPQKDEIAEGRTVKLRERIFQFGCSNSISISIVR